MKIAALIKKEFHRFFHDPRLIIAMLFPGILIYAIYSLMGNFMTDDSPKKYAFRVYLSGESVLTEVLEEQFGTSLTFLSLDGIELDDAKAFVESGEATALVVFPENFDEDMKNYDFSSENEKPSLEIYYRSADTESAVFYAIATAALSSYQNRFEINDGAGFDFSDQADIVSSVMSGILPFMVVVFIFSACMSITLESVAGEKERGTLTTVLVTSVKRSHVALGKVIPLSCIATIGAASSFLGVSLSMPKLMGASMGSVIGGFGFLSYFFLFLLTLSVVPLIVSLISVVSAYAKSSKEAGAYTSVVMILVMVVSLVSAFVPIIGGWVVCIPILNVVVCMQNILTMSLSIWQSLVSFGLNFVYTALLILLISKMLSSERIMFGK